MGNGRWVPLLTPQCLMYPKDTIMCTPVSPWCDSIISVSSGFLISEWQRELSEFIVAIGAIDFT